MQETDLMELQEEVEMVQGMFEEGDITLLPSSSSSGTNNNNIDKGHYVQMKFQLETVIDVRVPPVGYPLEAKPVVYVREAPNVCYQMELERTLTRRISEELELGIPMLALIALLAREETDAIVAEVVAEEAARTEKKLQDLERQRELEEELLQQNSGCHAQMVTPCGIKILRGEPISDRKSKFLAHVAPINSEQDGMAVVKELRGNKWIVSACHPTIYAYRFRDQSKGIIAQDAEDDGEAAAAKKILFLLEQAGVEGYIVVVTRWFGGILLGPDRFKHIMECSRQALVQHGILVKPSPKK